MENTEKTVPSAIDDVAAAEAELRAAQERLDAAKQRLFAEQGAGASQAYQQSPYQQVPPQGAGAQGQSYQAYQPYQGYQQAYQQANQPYGQSVASKDHLVAGLLAIFLGTLGIHKFYLGYNKAGVIMLCITLIGSLLTIGIAAAVMGVIAIIEGIIYLTKPQPEFERIYVYNKKEWF